ncbi:MAG: hypothetical protein U5R06_12975 [candidate division KSB1 bacterium]|nr:hypothetical protein [candidate division KSB1 bacterium]
MLIDNKKRQNVIKTRNDPENAKFYDRWFAKRGVLELYDCEKDPAQLHNPANHPDHNIVNQLRSRLIRYFETTKDPGFTDQACKIR